MKRFPFALRKKKLIVFDLDGTLAESKSSIDREMSRLFGKLLACKMVAVISGGQLSQFKKQLLDGLRVSRTLLKNLFLFPTTSTSFYRYRSGWKKVYAQSLSSREKKKIHSAFEHAFVETGYRHPKKTYGKVIEDRGTQVTFSALGQEVVARFGKRGVQMKAEWNKRDRRPELMRVMRKYIPEFEVRSGGLTSIDVTRKGIDKAYGVRQIRKELHVPIRNMFFVGDAIFPGGNDYQALKTGIDYAKVGGPEDTKKLIRFLVSV